MLKFLKNFFGAKPAKAPKAPYKVDADKVKAAIHEVVCGDKKPAKKPAAKKAASKTSTKSNTTKKKV